MYDYSQYAKPFWLFQIRYEFKQNTIEMERFMTFWSTRSCVGFIWNLVADLSLCVLTVIIFLGGRYEPVLLDNAYKVHMKLTIRAVGPADLGTYRCVSKNSLGDTDGSIKLYRKK